MTYTHLPTPPDFIRLNFTVHASFGLNIDNNGVYESFAEIGIVNDDGDPQNFFESYAPYLSSPGLGVDLQSGNIGLMTAGVNNGGFFADPTWDSIDGSSFHFHFDAGYDDTLGGYGWDLALFASASVGRQRIRRRR